MLKPKFNVVVELTCLIKDLSFLINVISLFYKLKILLNEAVKVRKKVLIRCSKVLNFGLKFKSSKFLS
jgi:hypothetical protein